MQFEMFEMLQFIDSNVIDEPEFYKTLPDMTEMDVRKFYMLLKKTKPLNKGSSSKKQTLSSSI